MTADLSAAPPALFGRRVEVREWLLTGEDLYEIAAVMGLSIHTLRGYVKDVFRHAGVHSRVELMGLEIVRLRGVVADQARALHPAGALRVAGSVPRSSSPCTPPVAVREVVDDDGSVVEVASVVPIHAHHHRGVAPVAP